MEEAKAGCLALVILTVVTVMCVVFWHFRPESEPLLVIRTSRPAPVATPNVFHQVILEQVQTENEIELLTARHELRKQWACIAAPWAMIVLGGYCFVTAWRKWLKASS